MRRFEFHYQYQPDDLRAIRQANSEVIFSPANSLSAAAIGFALAMLILGAIGAWIILWVVLAAGLVVLVVFARKLNAQSRGNREYQLRQLQLHDQCLVEISGNSETRKSWDVFEEVIQTDHHIMLRHYQRIIAIPKRVIESTQMEACLDFIKERVGEKNSGPLPEFSQWFSAAGSNVFRFTWNSSDKASIRAGQLKRFDDAGTSTSEALNRSALSTWVVWLLASVVVFLILFIGPGNLNMDGNHLIQIAIKALICIFALTVPLLAIWIWRRYTMSIMRKMDIRIPEETIGVADTGEFLVVGYEGAVSKYDTGEITALYLGSDLIGFRIGTGPVNVIPVRAFGDLAGARRFLSDLRRNSHRDTQRPAEITLETGNPYQPPHF